MSNIRRGMEIPVSTYMLIMKDRLIKLRKDRKLTQEQLAEELGATRSAISSWELGTRQPDSNDLRSLSEFYHVTVDYILGFVEKENEIVKF